MLSLSPKYIDIAAQTEIDLSADYANWSALQVLARASDGTTRRIAATNLLVNRPTLLYPAGSFTAFALYYLSGANWILASAEDDTTGAKQLLGIALATSAQTKGMCLHGLVTNPSWAFTPGSYVFMSVTSGAVTQVPTTASGAVRRPIGHAVSATQLFLNPDVHYTRNA